MTTIAHLVQAPLAKALGWTILHSLWEGALAALLLLAALLVIRSSRARYICACAAMLGVLAAFVLTFSILAKEGERSTPAIPYAIPRTPLDDGQSSPDTPARFRIADVPPWLAPIWMAGVLLFHVRSAAGWMAAGRLPAGRLQRTRSLAATARPTPRQAASLEAGRAARNVSRGRAGGHRLSASGDISTHGSAGGNAACQLEAVLMHELAHIRRRDYLANILQTVVESFLFYHPATWWMSGVIRAEREKCCDDLVVDASGNAHEYAAALAALEQTRWTANEAVLAATGGNLMKRIHRLLYQPKASALAAASLPAYSRSPWSARWPPGRGSLQPPLRLLRPPRRKRRRTDTLCGSTRTWPTSSTNASTLLS